MFSSTVVALASLAASALGANIAVTVGGPGILKYDPETVTANPGDVVVFTFKQKNHTATQSTLANPCTHSDGGFDSDYVPVTDTATTFPVARFEVKDTKPVWVYCKQGTHCQSGMVFAINPGTGATSFDTFKANAQKATGAAATGTASAGTTSSTGTTTGSGTDHKVVVGGPGQLIYNPAQVQAQPGDTITFEFHQKNHTVTQSTFANPCGSNGGFDSGYMPVADAATTFPSWTVKVNDTTPIWAYCRQSGHCGQGMVFAANSVESGANNFAAFQAKAKASGGASTNTTASGTGTAGAAVSGRRMGAGSMVVLGLVTVFGMMI